MVAWYSTIKGYYINNATKKFRGLGSDQKCIFNTTPTAYSIFSGSTRLYPQVYVCIFSLVYQNRLLPLYNLFISESWRHYSCTVTNVTVFTFFLVKCHKLSKTRIWHSQTVTLIEMLTPFYSGGPTKQHPVICSAHTAPRGTLPGINALISIFTLTPIWRAWTNVCPLL